MKPNDIKQIRDAFARLAKAADIKEFENGIIKITTDYRTITEPICFYAYMKAPSKKIYFTDGGRVWRYLQSSGQKIQDSVLQALIQSYGLELLDDNSIIDQQNEPLHERITNIIQIQIGIDTMIRTWKCYANKIKTKESINGAIQTGEIADE